MSENSSNNSGGTGKQQGEVQSKGSGRLDQMIPCGFGTYAGECLTIRQSAGIVSLLAHCCCTNIIQQLLYGQKTLFKHCSLSDNAGLNLNRICADRFNAHEDSTTLFLHTFIIISMFVLPPSDSFHLYIPRFVSVFIANLEIKV